MLSLKQPKETARTPDLLACTQRFFSCDAAKLPRDKRTCFPLAPLGCSHRFPTSSAALRSPILVSSASVPLWDGTQWLYRLSHIAAECSGSSVQPPQVSSRRRWGWRVATFPAVARPEQCPFTEPACSAWCWELRGQCRGDWFLMD